MQEIRIHGRGGQGGITAAQIIVNAAFKEGIYGQAIPEFGAERRGAPIKVSLRLDFNYIPIRTQVAKPNLVIVLDKSLFDIIPVTKGLKEGGTIVVNSHDLEGYGPNFKVVSVDATRLARRILGKSIVNTAMLGAFCRATKMVSLNAVKEAMKEWFDEDDFETNIILVQKAFEGAKVREV